MIVLVALQLLREPPAPAPQAEMPVHHGPVQRPSDSIPPAARPGSNDSSPLAAAAKNLPDPGPAQGPEQPPGFYPSASLPDILAFLQRQSGPDLADHAWRLWGMPDPDSRRIAALLLSRLGLLTGEHLDTLQASLDLEQSLGLLGWLQVLGGPQDADRWQTRLASSVTPGALTDLLQSGLLYGAGARASLALTRQLMSPQETQALWSTLAGDQGLDYDLRMKALMLLRPNLPAAALRERLAELSQQTGDPDWADAVQRYSRRIQAPDPIMDAPQVIGPHSIDLAIAGNAPDQLRNLVIQLESAMETESSQFLPDTALRLFRVVEELNRQPISEVDQLSLARLSTLLMDLNQLELERPASPSPVDYPPGTLLPKPILNGPPKILDGLPPGASRP